ncbi:hypothetical protein AWC03_05990 [Mycobacterium europaeum]|uniref:DUF5631 domain-containing protein n=1 Tax=Mycobacterium europaeum TaxID=761804 RepID=UPI000A244528|nr:DUF5631 domain-containing protein [Mycobacterium europaeum]ORV62701.1 hypothetical protein AWC03_05990 [Mycobacterium europaeum]
MAIFGRMTARQRLRRATRESLAMPAFSSPIDCTPWVIGGLWPAELSPVTSENAALAEYLRTDLQRIADSANEQLKMIKRAGLADLPRQAEETRVIDEARARAVRRVESTIRQLRAVNAGVTVGHPRPQVGGPPSSGMDQTRVIPAVTGAEPPDAAPATVHKPRWRIARKPAPVVPQGGGDEPGPPPDEIAAEANTADTAEPGMEETQVIPSVTDAEAAVGATDGSVQPGREPAADGRRLDVAEPVPVPDEAQPAEQEPPDDDDGAAAALEQTQVIPVITEPGPVMDRPTESSEPVADGRRHVEAQEAATCRPEPERAAEPVDDTTAESTEETQVIPAITDAGPVNELPVEAQPAPQAPPADGAAASLQDTQVIPAITEAEPVVGEPAGSGRHHAVVGEPVVGRDVPQAPPKKPAPPRDKAAAATGFEVDRLNRLLEYVVRQEPRLNWAVGDRADGTTVLVTDLAHGWIPAGITLPAGVRLLEPDQRSGRVSALIGDAVRVVTYAPGDSLHRSVDFAATKSSLEPRELPAIEDLGTVLSQTTRRFDGLPRIVQRLADAAAAGAVIIDQEVDVLRVHLDTARYQLLVQYPAVNPALLLKCLLMAATEGIASGDAVSANYHLAWFQKLAGRPPGT